MTMNWHDDGCRTKPTGFFSIWPIVVTLLTCLIAQGLGWVDGWRFDREMIEQGEWVRLISGNLVHLGWSHLFMNMLGLLMVYLLVWPVMGAGLWSACILLSSLGVCLGLWWWTPSIHWYVGFSGTLHGLLLAGGLLLWRSDRLYSAILVFVVSGKLVWEQVFGALPGTAEAAGGPVVVDAHLYGGIAGVIFALGLIGVTAGRGLLNRR